MKTLALGDGCIASPLSLHAAIGMRLDEFGERLGGDALAAAQIQVPQLRQCSQRLQALVRDGCVEQIEHTEVSASGEDSRAFIRDVGEAQMQLFQRAQFGESLEAIILDAGSVDCQK